MILEDGKFKASLGNLARPCLKMKSNKRTGDRSTCSVVEYLPIMHKALNSISNTKNNKEAKLYIQKLTELKTLHSKDI